jgi:hypothetical protein
MADGTTNCPPLPVSSQTVDGRLEIQQKSKPSSPWEFAIRRSAELSKLPNYPVTHLHCRRGIDCTLVCGKWSCPAAYHGYGGGIYIGSRGMRGKGFTDQYRAFLQSLRIAVGVDVEPIPVKLDFRPSNTVYISGLPSFSGKATTPIPTNSPS